MNKKPILSCENLSKTFTDAGEKLTILRNINLNIFDNQLTAIVGVSGSGKSTLLQLLGGLDSPSSGTVSWHDQAITELSEKKICRLRNRHLGFIYQFHHLLPEFTALENVAMPLLIRGVPVKIARDTAYDFLKQVGLSERTHHKSAELSGGERQRVAIARALVTKPACVLADEPTGNLDPETAQQVIDTMLNLQTQLGTSFVIVTHDLNLAKRMQTVYRLTDGQIEN